ncbi:MAG TPA: hypothetical protein VGN88_06555 [Phycisphaerae bacterium]|jgi:hypothetical protein
MTLNEVPPNVSASPDMGRPVAAREPASETAFLLNYLKDHDARCPLCKYNLRQLTQPRCPECGREIRLTVGLTEPHLLGYILFLVPMMVSAGAGIICVTFMIMIAIQRGGEWFVHDLFRTPAVAVLFLGPSASLFPALLSVVLFRLFLRMPKAVQYVLAGITWLWDAALLAFFAYALLRL